MKKSTANDPLAGWVADLKAAWKKRAACRPGMGVDPKLFFSNWVEPAKLICGATSGMHGARRGRGA